MVFYDKERPETVQALFGSIAASYDKTNAILSFQLHRFWNRSLIKSTFGSNRNQLSLTVADLCCGTGEIAFAWLKSARQPQQAYLIDFCPEMLACAKNKAQKISWRAAHDIAYMQADVQTLPLKNDSIDYATMAYGIRNVKDPRQCFIEVQRTLKPGGMLGILELTEPTNRLLRSGHKLYLKYFLPMIGKLATSNGPAYKYLSNSIGEFTKPHELAALLMECGFSSTRIIPLSGGIATIILGAVHE